MRVLLKAPTEKACIAFETLLVGTWYFSDDAEGSKDVCYTVDDECGETARQWIASAQASGLLAGARLLGEEENTASGESGSGEHTVWNEEKE